jgi:hypothetical protein
MSYNLPPKPQACGCHAPHVLCPVGDNLQQRYFRLGVDIDAALAENNMPRYAQAKQVRAEAEAAYLRHIGMLAQETPTLDQAMQRVFALRIHPEELRIVAQEMRRLYRAAGEREHATLSALLGDVTPEPTWTPTTTPPPLYTGGCPQEPELDA